MNTKHINPAQSTAPTQRPKVIVTEHLNDEAADWLAQRTDLVRCPHDQTDELNAHLAEAHGLVVRTYTIVDDAFLSRAPNLKVVGRAGVGLDNIDLIAAQARNVSVVYTPDANTQAVVEYLWGLILDVVRPRPLLTRYVPPTMFHDLRKREVGRQLDRLTLGIIGMGRIGRRIATVAEAIGMRTLYNDVLPHADLHLPNDMPSRFADIDTLLSESDIVTIHVDGRSENRRFIDSQQLAKLKRNALLLNTSRGMVIDPAALADWAKSNATHGATAVIDVHDPEPPPDDYPLFGLDNVHLLPHLASRTNEALANMSWVVRDVHKVLTDQKPDHPAY